MRKGGKGGCTGLPFIVRGIDRECMEGLRKGKNEEAKGRGGGPIWMTQEVDRKKKATIFGI